MIGIYKFVKILRNADKNGCIRVNPQFLLQFHEKQTWLIDPEY